MALQRHSQQRSIPQLSQVVEEACRELKRSPRDAAEMLKQLREDWVTDLWELANLSEAEWQYLRIPGMLKVFLRRRCDDLFERVLSPRGTGQPQLFGPRNDVNGRSRAGVQEVERGGSAEKRSSPPWYSAQKPPLIESDRGEALGDNSQPLQALRRKLKQNRVETLRDIRQMFSKADVSADGVLNRAEFDRLLKEVKVDGIDSPPKVQALWNMFDRDKNGVVSSHEFLRTIRGRMSPQRENLVKQGFDLLDIQHVGAVDRWDLVMNFDPCPEARERDVPIMEVLRGFLAIGKRDDGHLESRVSKTEFLAYYDNVSAFLDSSDLQFAQLVRSTWSGVPKYLVGRPEEDTSHSAFAICCRIRKHFAAIHKDVKLERKVAKAIWQLVHGTSRDVIDRNSFEYWIEELHGRSLSEVDRQILFEVIDVDGDGFAHPVDFIRALQSKISSKRQQIIEDAFSRISTPAGGSISWEQCEIPPDLLELLSMADGSESLSKKDFLDYYLSCSIFLKDDKALETLLSKDWKASAKAAVRSSAQPTPGIYNKVGNVSALAKISAGAVNPHQPAKPSRPQSATHRPSPFAVRRGTESAHESTIQSADQRRASAWESAAWPTHRS